MKQKTLFTLALACLLGAFIIAVLVHNVEPEEAAGPTADLALLLRADAPSLGLGRPRRRWSSSSSSIPPAKPAPPSTRW
jgi:hypothetical protein